MNNIPVLTSDIVQVWLIPLIPSRETDSLMPYLSVSEQHRADQFVHMNHRRRYIQSHTALRYLLAYHTQIPITSLSVLTNAYGKPYLPNTDIQFNLSHSEDYAVIVFVANHAVGIDIEWIRPIDYEENIVRECFSPWEYSVYSSCSPAQRQDVFFNGWTGKEAFSKAIGLGHSFPFQHIEFMLDPNQQFALYRINGSHTATCQWKIRRFNLPSYVICIAVNSTEVNIPAPYTFNFGVLYK